MDEYIDINRKNIFAKSSGNGYPIIFLHSNLLTSFNKDVINILCKKIKQIKTYEIKKYGHLLNLEKGEELNKIIEEYIYQK